MASHVFDFLKMMYNLCVMKVDRAIGYICDFVTDTRAQRSKYFARKKNENGLKNGMEDIFYSSFSENTKRFRQLFDLPNESYELSHLNL